ncbi:MAG: carbohydrate binding domain-containing protein, partial [Planctomycetota bacterium]
MKLQSLLLLLFLSASWSSAQEEATELVVNGGFETVDGNDARVPKGWKRPDGLGVKWADVPAGREGGGTGKAIVMDTSIPETVMEAQWRKVGLKQWHIPEAKKNAIADTYGLSLYSLDMEVKKGQAYRIAFDFMGKGGAKVWVRGYGILRGKERRFYETYVNCRNGVPTKWTPFEQLFHPTRRTKRVTLIRIMLFAYHPPGKYWFDNLSITPVSDEAYQAQREADKK